MRIERGVWLKGLVLVTALALHGAVLGGPVIKGTADVDDYVHYSDGLIEVWGDGHSGASGYGGIYALDIGATTGEADYLVRRGDGWVNAFCIDLPQSPRLGWHDLIDLDEAPLPQYGPMGATKSDRIRELWGRYFDTIFEDENGPRTDLETRRHAEAFSAAVWEIVYEDAFADVTDYDVTSWDGTAYSFRCEQLTYASTANTWLHSLDGTGPKAHLHALTHASGQDFVVEVVPLPASLSMMLAGFAGMGGIRWVRRRAGG